jgi:hypothetical protein
MKDFDKNGKGDVIRVQVNEFKGATYLDIRVYYTAGHDKGSDRKPTRTGIAIPIKMADDVIEAAQRELSIMRGEVS